ncbi:MAG: maltokinase N-terminal cap-like domain-containing protein [Nitrospiraceae bacterium]
MSTLIDQVAEAVEHGGRNQVIQFLTAQRWFGAKGRRLTGLRLLDYAVLADIPCPAVLAIVHVEFADGPGERYFLPLIVRSDQELTACVEAKPVLTIEQASQSTAAWELITDASACFALLDGIRQGHQWQGRAGSFTCLRTPAIESLRSLPHINVKVIGAEQSNTSLVYDSRAILKLVRKLEAGVNPDGEILEFLTTKTSYRHVPALLGHIRYDGGGRLLGEPAYSATVAMAQIFIPNEGDGWAMALRHLADLLAASRTHPDSMTRPDRLAHVTTFSRDFLSRMRRLGEITADLHVALASDSYNPSFRPEPATEPDISRWQNAMRSEIRSVMAQLQTMPPRMLEPLSLNPETMSQLEARCLDKTKDASLLVEQRVMKIRIHGDYHLGQVLSTSTDFVILDFEGEPARTLEERRAKACPLKDVAGMLRSFNYARHVARRQSSSTSDADGMILETWEEETVKAFLAGYQAIAKPGEVVFLPNSLASVERLLTLFQVEKAIYELRYEINNRPDWVEIPIQGLQKLLESR